MTHEGTIVAVKLDKGFGFIRSPGQPDCFFHQTALADELDFDDRLQERRVTFELVETERGYRAVNVQPAT